MQLQEWKYFHPDDVCSGGLNERSENLKGFLIWNLTFQILHGLKVFSFPISVSVDLVPSYAVESSLGNLLVILLIKLVLATKQTTSQRRVGIEGQAVVSETRNELLFHL